MVDGVFFLESEKKRMRKRVSYKFWKAIYDYFKQPRSVDETLLKIFQILDAKHAFGYRTAADYHYESLQFLLEEMKNV